MKQISYRVIIAVLGGALIWQGALFLIERNFIGLILIFIGIAIIYKSRFW